MSKRLKLKFVPEWGDFEGIAYDLAYKNAWRLQPLYDEDDIVQEARIIFERIVDRYWPDKINNSRHFSTFFYTSINNKIINLSKGRSRKCCESMSPEKMDERASLDRQFEEVDVKDMLEAVKGYDPLDRLVRRLMHSKNQSYLRVGFHRETTNQFYSRLAGAKQSLNLREILRRWIEEGVLPCSASTSRSTSILPIT